MDLNGCIFGATTNHIDLHLNQFLYFLELLLFENFSILNLSARFLEKYSSEGLKLEMMDRLIGYLLNKFQFLGVITV